MPSLKNIGRLSDSEEKKRAAAFEAQMLAMLAKDKSATADKPAVPVKPAFVTPPPALQMRDGIQIAVTANGQTTLYDDLEAVPAPIRQQILNAWRPDSPPVIESEACTRASVGRDMAHGAVATPKPRSRRVAMTLNLFLPGAGQFYLGQPLAGSLYAIGFIACFVACIVNFLRGYGDYIQMSTGGDIFETGNLERLTQSLHTGWLIGLQGVAIAIYIASAIHLSRSRSA